MTHPKLLHYYHNDGPLCGGGKPSTYDYAQTEDAVTCDACNRLLMCRMEDEDASDDNVTP